MQTRMRKPGAHALLLAVMCLAACGFAGCSDEASDTATTPETDLQYVQALLDLPDGITHEEAMGRFYEAAMIIDDMNAGKEGPNGPLRAGDTCGDPPLNCEDLFDDDYDFEQCPPSTGLPRASILVAEYDIIMAGGGFEFVLENGSLYCEQRGGYTTGIPETQNDDLRHINWTFYGGGGCGWAPCASSDYHFSKILDALANHSLIIGNVREVSAYRDPVGKPKWVGHFMNVYPCGTKLIRRVCYDPNYQIKKPWEDPYGERQM
jgi:hypothetical protein